MKKKYFGLAGIIGSLSYFASIIIFGLLKPGYSQIWQTVSELNARGEANAIALNICYSISAILLIFFSFYFILKKNFFAKISGLLMAVSFAGLIFVNWFTPMDQWHGIRTPGDIIHNSVVTSLVVAFLISQIFFIYFWFNERKYNQILLPLTLFFASLFFALISLWANINQSEVINISERGWILTFLIWIFILSCRISRKELV